MTIEKKKMEERKFEEIEKVGMGMKKRRFGAEGEDEGLVIMWQGGFEGKDWSAASYMGLEGRSGVRRGSLMSEIETFLCIIIYSMFY